MLKLSIKSFAFLFTCLVTLSMTTSTFAQTEGSQKVTVKYKAVNNKDVVHHIDWDGKCLEKLTDGMIRALFTNKKVQMNINNQTYGFTEYSHDIAKDKWKKYTEANPQNKAVAELTKMVPLVNDNQGNYSCFYKIMAESNPKEIIAHEFFVKVLPKK
jgi:hypothetical protein